MFNADHLCNPALLAMTKQAAARSGLGGFGKFAFVPGGEGMGGGGGDPAAGGAPPGDPAAGGGAPPGDPMAGGGGGGPPPSDPRIDQMAQQIQQLMTQVQQGGGAGAGGAGGAPLKPKIDVNVEMMQIKNMMAKICDHLQIPIPAQDMVATPEKLQTMAAGGSAASPGGAPGGAAGGGGGAIGGMPPMDPMQGAGQPGADKMGSYRPNGSAFDTTGLGENFNKAAAIVALRKRKLQAA